jgi:hypothetical protein
MRFVKGDQIRGKKASVFSLGPKRSQFNSCARLFWYKQQDTEGGDGGGQGAPGHGGGEGGGGAQRRRPTGRHSSGVVNSGYLSSRCIEGADRLTISTRPMRHECRWQGQLIGLNRVNDSG